MRADAADRRVETVALAHHRLCGGGVIPEVGVAGLDVQFVEAGQRGIPVKDAS